MDVRLTPEQLELKETARRFVRNKLPAVAEHYENSNTPPSRELIREFAEMGFLAIDEPEQPGGLGLGNLEALLILEQFAQISSAVAFRIFESCVGPVRAIGHFGNDTLEQAVAPAVCRGEKVVAGAMAEPAAGSALTDLMTRASAMAGRRFDQRR